ncbi:hypothetical protein D3C86_924490 [compost metagenome]
MTSIPTLFFMNLKSAPISKARVNSGTSSGLPKALFELTIKPRGLTVKSLVKVPSEVISEYGGASLPTLEKAALILP